MKKYLMTGIAAVALCAAFTSCSHDLEPMSQADIDQAKYDQAFLKYVGGKIAPDQDWGFSSSNTRTRANNPGEGFAATSTGINANANEWADPTPGKTFGGLVVPDPLDPRVKALVAEYFKTHKPLDYVDPQWRNFFVQQVFTGDATNYDANGNGYPSSEMNELSVGHNHQHINNFNAASYGATTVATDQYGNNLPGTIAENGGVNVLDKGYTANDFAEHHHADEIMLMVDIDDTECFGYKNSASSQIRDDKMALVGWETIYDWAKKEGKDNYELLKDDWNRSYLGFDFELYDKESSYYKVNGEKVNAKFTDGQLSGLGYVWTGTEVQKRGTKPAGATLTNVDLTSVLENAAVETGSLTKNSENIWVWTGNFSVSFNQVATGYEKLVIEFAEPVTSAFGIEVLGIGNINVQANDRKAEINITGEQTITGLKFMNGANYKINSIYLKAPSASYYESDYLLVNGEEIPFLITNKNMYGGTLYGGADEGLKDADMQIVKDGVTCFNMEKIAELVGDGYLPVWNTNLRTWVKWAGGDGYYDDWIVTLTKAEKIVTVPDEYDIIIVAEDLSAGEDGDFDFNDVVLKVKFSKTSDEKAKVLLTHAGGTLPLRINGDFENLEVHKLFGVWVGADDDLTVRQKMVNTSAGPDVEPVDITDKLNINIANAAEANTKLKLEVYKDGEWQEMKSPKGEPACKLAVGTDFKVLGERVSIKGEYENFIKWVELGSNGFTSKWWQQVTTE